MQWLVLFYPGSLLASAFVDIENENPLSRILCCQTGEQVCHKLK